MTKKKKYDKNLKARIALEAVKGERIILEIASWRSVPSNQIDQWKKKALTGY